MLWGAHISLFTVFSPVFSSLFPCSIVSLLLIVSRCFPPLVCSLLSHSVQVEATCCPGRSRSVRLQWQVSRWQLGSIAKAPNYVNLTLAARKQAEKKNADKDFIITDYTYIMHVSVRERRRDEECFLSENAIINHFNLLQSVIVIYQNP